MTLLSRTLARRLEQGTGYHLPAAHLIATGFGAWATQRLDRAHPHTPNPHALRCTGSTLGGSWKTPLALALAEALAHQGIATGYVAHGYGASLSHARRVTPHDPPTAVGDETVMAMRRLASLQVPVVMAGPRPWRSSLLSEQDVVVFDGVCPAGEYTHLLCLDAHHPWGAGTCPPCGDLRAPPRALLRSAHEIIVVHDDLEAPRTLDFTTSGSVWPVPFELTIPPRWHQARMALVTAIARPDRVRRALQQRNFHPTVCVELPDHAGPRAAEWAEKALRASSQPFDVVFTTEKCACWLPSTLGGCPVVVLPCRLRLPGRLLDHLRRAVRPSPP